MKGEGKGWPSSGGRVVIKKGGHMMGFQITKVPPNGYQVV